MGLSGFGYRLLPSACDRQARRRPLHIGTLLQEQATGSAPNNKKDI